MGSIPVQEAILYLHGASLCLALIHVKTRGARQSGHSPPLAEPRLQRRIDMGGTFIFLIPFALFTLWSSLPYVRFSWSVLEASSAPVDYRGVLAQVADPTDGGAASYSGLCRTRKMIATAREQR